MKLYTLEYDCNSPVVQQINVPTNTDYKLGIKVKRNGEIQSLSPDSVTLGGLSADAEKTNGYVTFTKSTSDNASFTQLDVQVDKNYAGFGPDEASNFGTKLTSPLSVFKLTTSAEVLAPCVGKPILSENVKMEYSLDGENWKDIDGTGTTALDFFVKVGNEYPFKYKLDERKWLDLRGASTLEEAKRLDSLTFEEGWSMFNNPVSGNKFPPACPDFSGTLSASNPIYVRVIFLLGAGELHQSFKLNTNVFKSQQGDIYEIGKRANTVSIAGTFSDSTPFDYNVAIK